MGIAVGTPQTKLSAVIAAQGRQQGWVAAQVGVDKSQMSQWCTGKRKVPAKYIRPLAELLSIDPIDLLDDAVGAAAAAT